LLIEKMTDELRRNGVELRKKVLVDRILVEERNGRKVACGIVAGNGRVIRAKAILSNANIKNTIFRLAGRENFTLISPPPRTQSASTPAPAKSTLVSARANRFPTSATSSSPRPAPSSAARN
jgi:phytoene dehydrogenase-like protein